jgi:Protein of unknown function (DUF2924)
MGFASLRTAFFCIGIAGSCMGFPLSFAPASAPSPLKMLFSGCFVGLLHSVFLLERRLAPSAGLDTHRSVTRTWEVFFGHKFCLIGKESFPRKNATDSRLRSSLMSGFNPPFERTWTLTKEGFMREAKPAKLLSRPRTIRSGAEDLVSEVSDLLKLDARALCEKWREVIGEEPSLQFERTVLLQAISYRLQERALGGLKPSVQRIPRQRRE